jgi:hypothetical protein
MNTTLLIDQLTTAVLASVVALALIQKIKAGFPSRWVGLFSACVAFFVGFLFALYYRKYDLIACVIVGVYTFVGADGLYQSFSDKLKSYIELSNSPKVVDDPNRVG